MQEPQAAETNRLTFLVAAQGVARVLGARGVMLEVGGVVARLKEE